MTPEIYGVYRRVGINVIGRGPGGITPLFSGVHIGVHTTLKEVKKYQKG
jgi:hypothetical protein